MGFSSASKRKWNEKKEKENFIFLVWVAYISAALQTDIPIQFREGSVFMSLNWFSALLSTWKLLGKYNFGGLRCYGFLTMGLTLRVKFV